MKRKSLNARAVVVGVVLTGVLLAACGSDDESTVDHRRHRRRPPRPRQRARPRRRRRRAAPRPAPGRGSTAPASTPSSGTAGAGGSAENLNLAIPADPDPTNPEGYGQDDDDPNLYHGAGGFTLDVSDCPEDWNATQGAEDGTIKLWTALPLSGPIASVGIYGQGIKSYFDYVNANGGIDGKKVQLDLNDNQYLPDKTKTVADEVIADGSYFAAVGINGTPHNLAIWDMLNDECMPTLVTGSGAAEWGDVEGHPWTGPGETFAYVAESRVQAEWLKSMLPDGGKVATITINNDFGKQYLTGLKEGLKGSNIEVVATEFHEPGGDQPRQPVHHGRRHRRRRARARVVGHVLHPGAGRRAASTSWKPIFLLPTACGSTTIFQPLIDQGLTGDGAYLVQTTTQVNDPSVADAPFVKAYYDFLPTVGLDPNSTVYAGGWQFGWAATEILKLASTYKGGLNRANVMLAHRAMDQALPLLLPGLQYRTFGVTDEYLFEGGQVAQYKVTDPKAVGHVHARR